HLTGDLQNVRFTGPVRVPNFAFNHPRYGAAQSSILGAVVDGVGNASGVQLTAKINAPDGNFRQMQYGAWSSGALRANVKFAAFKNAPTRVESVFDAAAVRGLAQGGA